MKLRHRKRYIVTDPHDSGGFGLTCLYMGKHPDGHLFVFQTSQDSGYWLSDAELPLHVREYTKALDREIQKEAEKWLKENTKVATAA